MKGSIIKLISSFVLFILSVIVISLNEWILQFSIAIIVMSIIKFLIVMILEPDSIWEIIKKFAYLFVALFIGIGIAISNKYLIKVLAVVLILDSFFEFFRFFRNIRLLKEALNKLN